MTSNPRTGRCRICGKRGRYIQGDLCDACMATRSIIQALLDVITEKIENSTELNTEEPEFRWLAGLAALFSDYRPLAHIYRFYTLALEYIRHPGQSVSAWKIAERIRTLRDIDAWIRYYQQLGIIEYDGNIIKIPEGSILEKARVAIEAHGPDLRQRASFCVVGYVLLKIAEAIFTGNTHELPNGGRKLRRFIASIPFFLTRFIEGEPIRRSALRRFLSPRGVSIMDVIEKIEASFARSDTRKQVDWFEERRWQGIDEAIYRPAPYVIALFERVRERMRERERERERGYDARGVT